MVTGARVQLMAGHLPPLLHGRAGPGDRGAGRRSAAGCCGSGAAPARRRLVAGRPAWRRRRRGLRAARPLARLPPVAARASMLARRPVRGGRRRSRLPRIRGRGTAIAVAGRRGHASAGPPRTRSTAAHAAHRRDPDRRPGRRRRVGSGRRGGPGGRRGSPAAEWRERARAERRAGVPGTERRRRGPPAGRRGGVATGGAAPGGILQSATPSAALVKLLQQDAGRYTLGGGHVGSNTAAGYQLATGDPVMAIGGFNGSDPAPTLAQFEAYVAAGRDPLLHRRRDGRRRRPGRSDALARSRPGWQRTSPPRRSAA